MTIASIDIGTNTVLLLVAKVESSTRKIIPLHNEHRMPRIGQGTKQTGIITQDKLTLLFDVLKEYDSIIQRYNYDKILLTGTNAFRMSNNTEEIKEDIKKLFKYDLNVVSGEEEAEYAYLGAISNLDRPDNSMVVDIGGSSTEIIIGEKHKIISKNSLQMGSVSATEQYLKNSPPLMVELENLSNEIKNLLLAFDKDNVTKNVIAIAGTATTLACMKLGLKEFEEKKVDKSLISFQDTKLIIKELSSLKPAEILDRYGLVMKGREDIIFAGALILYKFMEKFGIEKVAVSTRGIRYGAIVNYLKNTN
ncbi:MAG: rod shape-determining protein [Ignavibacteriaceae bacterium]|nr:rod shape-determining protein [Ignavibacteriaceae bacterium]